MSADTRNTTGPRRNDDPETSGILIVGILSAIFLFVIIVAVQALFYNIQKAEHERKVVTQPHAEWSQVKTEQLETLNSYRWIDREKGVVGIPIERAMELFLEERGQRAETAPPGEDGS